MRLLLFIGLLNCVLALSAQQEAGTFLMNDELYQASHLNPAFMPEKDVYSVSSMYFNFTHNGFALKHLLTPKEDGGGVRDDSLIVNIPNAIYNMKDKNNFLRSERRSFASERKQCPCEPAQRRNRHC